MTQGRPQQLETILATDGPVVIIAGPGSGKTFTLVERIAYLIIHKGVAPESLLVATFTDKAARELTTRISNPLAEVGIQFNLNVMYLGTFHSICLRLLEDFRFIVVPTRTDYYIAGLSAVMREGASALGRLAVA
ncbi:UvrD-helicase domain-containing protein [Burkholderia multivorans]|uniref:UvrD-helicase domain-containing protein n=1 Tax=Burkholderia multivorans TaxID=87883 RepID=UPI0026601104|nr:UvrD-helicase domain-containing protein [Burkholderia multivorans]